MMPGCFSQQTAELIFGKITTLKIGLTFSTMLHFVSFNRLKMVNGFSVGFLSFDVFSKGT